MFKILIIEDNPDKLRETLQLLSQLQHVDLEKIDSESDILSAKKRLKEKFYDLLILDIAIPPRKSEEVDLEGGIKLLNEIKNRAGYKTPTHIIGLTAKEEIIEKAQELFQKSMLSVIKYSHSDIAWQKQLLEGVKQRIDAMVASESTISEYIYDVAIICALNTELDAVRANGWKWEIHQCDADDSIYYEAKVNSGDVTIKLIAAQTERMGMPATAALASKMIHKFRPKYIFMTGIMAGVTGRVRLGDIVIPSPVWDWGSGKWISEEDSKKQKKKSLFLYDPFQFSVDTGILKHIRLLADDSTFLFNLRKEYGSNGPKEDITVHIGPVATGASVLSDQSTFSKIKGQHRKLLGVEMEAYGLFSAAEVAAKPKPTAICIKSVVDFGDSEKDDDVHDYGAYISAKFASALILKIFS